MGFLTKIFGSNEPIEERASDNMEDLLLQAGLSGGKVTKEDALNIPALAAGIDLISDIVASLPVKLYKESGGKVEEVEDDRVRLLNDETKDTLNGFQFKKALISDFLLSGAGYAYINRKRNNIDSLHYVDASKISIMVGIDPIFKSYDISVNGQNYADYDFIKITRKSKDGVTGVSIVDEHNKLLSVIYNTLVFEDLLVRTGGNKKGFLKAQNKLSDEAIRSLKDAWKNLYSNNSENVVVLNNGIDFAEASSTSVEMQLNENKRTNTDEINRILRIPGGKIDDDAIKNCILPLLKSFETALNKDLLLPSEKEQSFYFAFDTGELTKGDIEKRFKAYEIAVKNGFLQIDEVRYMEDLAPLGLEFIKLGLQDVLYNPKTKEIYTPNTDKTGSVEKNSPNDIEDGQGQGQGSSNDPNADQPGGGENIEN